MQREENSRKGKSRDFVKKIGDTKEIFHSKMDTIRTEKIIIIKDRNSENLTEAEDMKKGWQK